VKEVDVGSAPAPGSRSRFSGKTALVTGGGTGIGRATALALAAEGANVVVTGRRLGPLEEVIDSARSAPGSVEACPGDVNDSQDVDDAVTLAVQHNGGIDVLVCSAGTAAEGSFLDTTLDSWRDVMATNLDGTFLVAQAVARHQVSEGRPCSIVTIGSMDSFGIDGPYASYHTSKHAVLGLTRAMAVELGPSGVRVNCVAPGFTNTGFDEWSPPVMDHLLRDFTRVPLRRMAEPVEVAAAVLFLASDDASAITGTALVVDSGLMASLHGVDSLPVEREGTT